MFPRPRRSTGTSISLLLVFVGAAPSCGRAPAPRKTAPPIALSPQAPHDPCAAARSLRTSAPKYFEAGRLDRTVRTLVAADRLCPGEAHATAPLLLAALDDLGKTDDARALAERITRDERADPAAKARATAILARVAVAPSEAAIATASRLEAEARAAADRTTARDRFVAARDAAPPNGAALTEAGLLARDAGDPVAARRLFDRAIVDHERETGGTLEIDVPNGFGGFASAIAWAPDDRAIAVAHRAQVRVVDSTTFRDRVRLRGHDDLVTAIAFSPDGRTIATASRDEHARLWDATTGRERRRLDGHVGEVTAIAFDPSGRILATGGRDQSVRLWDPRVEAPPRLRATTSPVTGLAFGRDGSLAAATTTGVIWWDRAGEIRGRVAGKATAIGASPTRFAAAIEPGRALIHDASFAPLRTIEVGTGATALSLTKDGDRLALAGLDGLARIFSVEGGQLLQTIDGHPVLASAVAWNGAGTLLASGGFDAVQIADRKGVQMRLERHAEAVTALAWSSRGDLAIGSNDQGVRILARGGAFSRAVEHRSPITGVTWSPDGAVLASVSLDGVLSRWGAAAAKPVDALGSAQAVAWSPDGTAIAVATSDRSLRLLRGDAISEEPGPGAYAIAWAPDGGRVAFAAIGKSAIVRARSGAEIARLGGHGGSVTAIAWSADGETIVTGSTDRSVRLWSATNFTLRSTIEVGEPITAIALRPLAASAVSLAIGTDSGAIHLAALGATRPAIRIAAHGESITSLAFDRGGRFLASGGRDGTTRVWSMPEAQLRLSVRAIRGRDGGYAIASDGEIALFGDVREYPICRVGGRAVPFELCEERFVAPDLVARLLR
jgi:WD40 repeat protein